MPRSSNKLKTNGPLPHEWEAANPEKAALLKAGLNNEVPTNLDEAIPEFSADAATRATEAKHSTR